jgi:hypothetical protein
MLFAIYRYTRYMSSVTKERQKCFLFIDTWVTCHHLLSNYHQLHMIKRSLLFIDTWDTCHQLHKIQRCSLFIDTWVTCLQLLSPYHQLHTRKLCSLFIDTRDICHQLHTRDKASSGLTINRLNVISHKRETTVFSVYCYVSHMSSTAKSISSVTHEKTLISVYRYMRHMSSVTQGRDSCFLFPDTNPHLQRAAVSRNNYFPDRHSNA